MAKNTLDALFKRINNTKKEIAVDEPFSFHLPSGKDTGNSFLLDIGTYVARLRRERHMSQSDLGEEVGIQQPYISLFENGHLNCRITTLVKILSVLDANVEICITPQEKNKREYGDGRKNEIG